MADITGARNRFIMAATVSAGAALVIRRPIAMSIAVSLGVMMADPDTMLKAMKEWKTKAQGGSTEELDQLVKSVRSLVERMEHDAHWDGAAKLAFDAVAEPFVEELEKMGTARDGIGDALKSSADLYDKLSYVAVAVALVMVGWAILVSVAKLNPGTWIGAEIALTGGMQALWTWVKPLLISLAVFTGGVFAVYQGVGMKSMEQAMKFQNMKAMPMMNGYGLGNDKESGALVQKSVGLDNQNGGLPTGMNLPGIS
ncbi:WXG100 family type VII secretion target [Nonomuraea lactucae]|uniref:WXG100 family type VII secretion target n=1 Tax=Nonomuraea lactucae TaxID=2249762 RepID=UPI000DE47DC7|nr:WXG100 family type VII secretion target [Nonomuraea lactucae]